MERLKFFGVGADLTHHGRVSKGSFDAVSGAYRTYSYIWWRISEGNGSSWRAVSVFFFSVLVWDEVVPVCCVSLWGWSSCSQSVGWIPIDWRRRRPGFLVEALLRFAAVSQWIYESVSSTYVGKGNHPFSTNARLKTNALSICTIIEVRWIYLPFTFLQ